MEEFSFGNPNYSNPNYSHSSMNMASPTSDFMLSDYLLLDDDVIIDHHHYQDSLSQSTESLEFAAASSDVNHGFGGVTTSNNNNSMQVIEAEIINLSLFVQTMLKIVILCIIVVFLDFVDRKCKNNVSKRKKQVAAAGQRVVFRTRSEIEVMDDGYKWRKYGKKTVKNSPNPRNYYKCSSVGCGVKKRVERDAEDMSYVLTSYDGIHNHQIRSSNNFYHNNNNTSPYSFFHTVPANSSSSNS
ncbi:WRKY Transcription Factor [Stylosanthes scabra]|uniref:WRKY Transcription Factor n=1 Tax=Stylosanthes scabra TaxID=79078 RepID=A0ABU6QKT9_9FABA|nr:WRKY Transcription Factor [Stylosanthes scabra]